MRVKHYSSLWFWKKHGEHVAWVVVIILFLIVQGLS